MPHVRHTFAESRIAAPATQRSRIAIGVRLVGCGALLGCVGVAPWFYGAIQPGIQVWLFVGAGLAMSCWLVDDLLGESVRSLPAGLVPLAGILALGAGQLIPLGQTGVSLLSPEATALRAELIASVPEDTSGSAAGATADTISLYPASTRRALSLVVLAVAVFLGGAVFFRTPKARLGLLVFVATLGGAIAFFDISQQILQRSSTSVWRLTWAASGAVFGPLVNRNSAAGLLNLCLAGAIGWIVWKFRVGSETGHGYGSGWRSRFRLLRHVDGPGISALGLAAFLVAGVLASMSRGGVLALLTATVVTLIVVRFGQRKAGWVWFVAMPVLVGLLILLWAGLGPAVRGRVASLMDERVLAEKRLQHWQDGGRVVRDYWRLGSGLGTYRLVYPQYQQRVDLSWYWHAENQPLEQAAEQGVVGLTLLVGAALMTAMAARQVIGADQDRSTYALGVAGLFALVAQAVSSLFDFGLCLPSNLILLSLLCGAMAGAAALGTPHRRWLAIPWPRASSLVVATSLLIGLAWGASLAHGSSSLQTAIKGSGKLQGIKVADAGELDPWIRQLEDLVARYPDEAEAHSHLSRLYVERYRAEALSQLRAERLGADIKLLAEQTSPFALHARLHELYRGGLQSDLEQLRATAVIQRNLLPALKHAFLARQGCPLLTTPHRTIAWLAGLVGSPRDDEPAIAAMRRLLPFHPGWRKDCGVLEFHAHRFSAAAADWRVAITNDLRLAAPIMAIAERSMSLPYVVEQVLPQSPLPLLQLAEDSPRARKVPFFRRLLAERAGVLVDCIALADAERHYLRGWSFVLQGRYSEGIEEYRQAVEARPFELRWRYRLAVVLKDQGLTQQAHEQALVCARLGPGDPTYSRLLEQVNRARIHEGASQK